MKRLYLTVEGQTEQAFAVEVLQPHLMTRNVFVWKPRLTGLHPRRRGQIPSGGLLNTFRHTLGDIQRWLREDQSQDARFSMMVDLYSLPNDFPGYSNAMNQSAPYRKIEKLEQSLSTEISDERFIPYIQVHEFEALVLSKPDVFLDWFDNSQASVDALRAECANFETPETINEGSHTHPKARIQKHFPDYQQHVDGPILVGDIGLGPIRDKCPHFDEWLIKLEQLDN